MEPLVSMLRRAFTPVIARLGNFIWARLKAWGGTAVKKKVWDKEFSNGAWDYIEHTAGDCVYQYIEKYCRKGSILDLGCGSGNTGNELLVDRYHAYTGVDISDVAVQKAKVRTLNNNRDKKNHYFQGDICSYEPDQRYDVILFRESIWYICPSKLQTVLDRYRRYLSTSGV